jgi:hypothetical protein
VEFRQGLPGDLAADDHHHVFRRDVQHLPDGGGRDVRNGDRLHGRIVSGFILKLVTGELDGGGPLEALLRTIFQKMSQIELDMGPVIDRAVPVFDQVLLFFLWIAALVFPDFSERSTRPGSSLTDSISAATCWPNIFWSRSPFVSVERLRLLLPENS